MKLTFYGATRQVTGSMYLLELDDDFRILIDCGLDLEKTDITTDTKFGLFPFEASMVNVVLLTHAHIDHSGNIPNLLREGFEGQILCTKPTYELTKLLLEDAAALNQKKLKKIEHLRSKKRQKVVEKLTEQKKELYFNRQVEEALEQFRFVSFHQKIKLTKEISVTFIPAGHLLGAAHLYIEITENGQTKRIGFSGDLGRKNYPLLIDPEPLPEVDYLICESTYGNRKHQSEGTPEKDVLEVIQATCVDIPGRLIIPAFSVGRTQAMLYTLKKLQISGQLPPIKVFADSPLATKTTLVYQKFQQQLNPDAQNFAKEYGSLFDFENLIYVENMQESKAVSNYGEPCIIISSSGMIQGGRVEYHVKKNLANAYATILLIGFVAEGTMGYELLNGKKTISIEKKEIPVQANIQKTDVFSGHGDLDDLTDFIKQQTSEKLKKIFLVHGEYESMTAFQTHLTSVGYPQVEIPKRGQTFEL